MGVVKNVGQIIWANGYANSTPINYEIQSSVDGEDWLTVKKVMMIKKGNNELIEDNFPVISAKYIKLKINDTFDGDSPVIGEIEVIEESFSNISKSKIELLEKNAYCVNNAQDKTDLGEFMQKRGIEGVVSWQTDKSIDNKVKLNFRPDGFYHTYKVVLQPGGTVFKNLKIESWLIPAKIFVTNLQLTYLDKNDSRTIIND